MAPFFQERNGAFLCMQLRKEKPFKIFDVSVLISAELPVWPGDPPIVLERYLETLTLPPGTTMQNVRPGLLHLTIKLHKAKLSAKIGVKRP